ncbi:hypothetical protein HSBAA_18790 [Vreelandella sulfidaeris]|uniref:Uncharacterized protein n=1 Tax=Vreelandella sulfidaeris TaxID=115553 RepID=A0A455U5T9_9GAMM|nr:hypothetical protein HSBAA_18790 [Halomonas sulfidaeris]
MQTNPPAVSVPQGRWQFPDAQAGDKGGDIHTQVGQYRQQYNGPEHDAEHQCHHGHCQLVILARFILDNFLFPISDSGIDPKAEL